MTGKKALKTKKASPKLVQVSKEHFRGKWQRVGFYEDKKGNLVDLKPI